MSRIKRHIHEQLEKAERDTEGRYQYHLNITTGERKAPEDLTSEVLSRFISTYNERKEIWKV